MTEKELVRHIAEANEVDDAAVRRWMDATPDEEVAKILHSIASRALSSSASSWVLPVSVTAQIAAVIIGIVKQVPVMSWLPILLVVLAQIPLYVMWIDQWHLRKARRAILYLAEQDPVRSINLLVLCFQRRSDSEIVWNATVEATLTDVLDESLESAEATWDQPRLYELVETIAGKESLHKAPADVDARRAYLLIAAIRLLARVGGWKNCALLQSIAKPPEPDAIRFPNRRLIYDCAVKCLAPPLVSPVTGTPTTALSTPTLASVTPAVATEPLPQVLNRS